MSRLIKSAYFRWLMIITILIVVILLPKKVLSWRYASLIYSPNDAPSRWLAIVFGAGLNRDGNPSPVLSDRVAVAVELYRQGRVSKILMSGSANPNRYDEPGAMRQLALLMGVPEEDILIDRGGLRTYETCRRAKELFEADQPLLISQDFHLPRALAICNSLGLNALGVRADLRAYQPWAYRYWTLREIPASLVAIWDSYVNPWLRKTPSPPS